MTTPNLNATGHQWVGALVTFNFQLEYQKGWDNTMADVLSWITTHLSPEAVQFILDGVALGATYRAEGYDPAVVESDYGIEKEVCVTTGWVLVEMHMTDWAKTQREYWLLNAVLDWLEAQKKTDLKTRIGEHASSKDWFGGITRILWFTRKSFTYAQHLRARMKICCSLWSQGCIGSPLWIDVMKMQDIRAMTICCPYCRSAFGGLGWPARCGNPSEPAHTVYGTRAACPRPLYTQWWLLLPWISYMLTSPA